MKLEFIDTTLSKKDQFIRYNKEIYINNLLLNENLNKAIVVFGIYQIGAYLCLLEREDDQCQWLIVKSEILNII